MKSHKSSSSAKKIVAHYLIKNSSCGCLSNGNNIYLSFGRNVALDGSVEEESTGESDHGHLQQILEAEEVAARRDATLQDLSEGQHAQKKGERVPQDRDIISEVHHFGLQKIHVTSHFRLRIV